jgi:HEAT repeat protein/beta-lactamase regulating signal transducer with metallopeptidase domain
MTDINLPAAWLPIADAVVKTTIVLMLAALVSVALRRASAALRHLVWTMALCSALLLPVLTFALPKWQIGLFTIADEAALPQISAPSDEVVPTAPPLARAQRTAPAAVELRTTAEAGRTPVVDPAPGLRSPETMSERRGTPSWLSQITWPQALFAIWAAGAMVILGRVAIGFAAIRWLSRRTQEITDAAWLPLARALASELGVTPRLRFLRSGRAAMPVAAGVFRPSVIMPADADGWSESRLRIVLLHELAHVKRRDCLTHLVAQAACAFYWFNPLAWLAVKRAKTERERACDDLVLTSGTRGPEYADQLLEMARALRGDRFPALLAGASLAMAHQSQLEGRLIAILDPKVPRAALSRGRTLAAVAICCGAVASLGSLQAWATGAATEVERDRTIASVPAQQTDVVASDSQEPAPLVSPDAASGVQQRRQPRADAQMPQAPQSWQGPQNWQGPQQWQGRQQWQGPQLPHAPQIFQVPHPAPMPRPMPTPMPTPHEIAVPIAQAVADGIGEGVSAFGTSQADAVKGAADASQQGRQTDPRLLAALLSALKDTDKEVRETAMHALVQIRHPSIFDPLVQALKDAVPDIRERAAFGLGQLRDKRAIQPLISALKEDTNADVREAAMHALVQLRDPSIFEPLVFALKDANADVREHAAFGLGQMRDKRAIQPLMAVLKEDSNANVREKAVFALGQLRDPSTVEALAIALRDSNASVKEQAAFALGQIRDRRAVEPLMSALKDSNPSVREKAAFALGQLRDPAAVEALIIAVKDTNTDVREQVVYALGQLRDPRAIEALTAALKDPSADVRQHAAFALGQLIR